MVFPKSLLFSLLSPNFYYAMTKKTLWWSESRDSHSTPRLTPPWTSDFSSIKWKDWKQDRKDSDQQKYSVIPLANLNPAPFLRMQSGTEVSYTTNCSLLLWLITGPVVQSFTHHLDISLQISHPLPGATCSEHRWDRKRRSKEAV